MTLFFREGCKKMATSQPTKTAIEAQIEIATLGAGCFWGVEEILRAIPGVVETTAGYMGGSAETAQYKTICGGDTGHAECVQIRFNSELLTYMELLSYFWRLHDPTQVNRQGVDVGSQYRSVIFYHSQKQRDEAEASKEAFDQSGVFQKKAATSIEAAREFYPAEEYHQDYFQKNGGHVCHILRDR